jgi:REP element-mobilizing transposase RayT
MSDIPLAYFITFTTYGTWLHDNERGSIIRKEGTTFSLPPQEKLNHYEQYKLKSPPLLLDTSQRKIILDVIIKHCNIRNWKLFATHIRSNHVHIVVKSNKSIDQTAEEFKSWATRMLRKHGLKIHKPWTSGSSKKYIFKKAKLREKIHYVVYEQGKPMQYYIDEEFKK